MQSKPIQLVLIADYNMLHAMYATSIAAIEAASGNSFNNYKTTASD
jgi:hypothetical protein